MDKYKHLGQLLSEFGAKGNVFIPAVVKSIEGNVCTVSVDGFDVSDVRLKATGEDTDNVVMIVPEVGSDVLVGSIYGNLDNLFIVQVNSVSEVHLNVFETSFKLDLNGIEMNGGKLGGLVKVEEMVKWMKTVYDDLQTLKTLLQTHPVAGNGSPLAMVFTPRVESPSSDKFANEKVLQ